MGVTQLDTFKEKVADLRDNGMIDIKFYRGLTNQTTPDDFCLEANRLLDMLRNDEGTELVFDDLPDGIIL